MKIRIHIQRAGLIVLLAILSLSARGQDPDSVLTMARKLAAREEYSRALALVTDLNRAYPENQDYIIYLARLYYWSKDYSKSKELLIPLTLADPVGQEAYDLMVEYQLGAYPSVIEKCQGGRPVSGSGSFLVSEAQALEKRKNEQAKRSG
jgi:tetratricopeptide (TPR) repeat protein